MSSTCIQLPILWALFYVFRNIKPLDSVTGQTVTVSFLWVKNLFSYDQLFILPILSGLTTFLSSRMMTPSADSAQAKQTSTMNIGMAIFMVFMAWKFTAALVLYWVANNLIQIAQTVLMKRMDAKANEA
jgi:YidC/Oxa1 family membrane protein insertase